MLARSSPLMLSSFLLSLFAGVEVTVQDDGLYCDALCEDGPDIAGKQVATNVFCCICLQMLHAVRTALTN